MRRLILSEGPGDEAFFNELIKVHGLSGFEVPARDKLKVMKQKQSQPSSKKSVAQGDGAFQTMLEAISIGSEYEDVGLVIVVADCDNNPAGQFEKVVKQIKGAGDFAVPSKPLDVAELDGKRSTAVLMLPWEGEKGALETLCYDVASHKGNGKKVGQCVEAFINCVEATGWKPQQLSKLKLRCIMASRCPRDPNTGLQYAWKDKGKKRPKDLIPLDSKNNTLKKIVDYLKSLPS
jgi:hypothetical protein